MLFKQKNNMQKVILTLLIVSTTSLFSANLKDIEILVSKISKSKKATYKKKLLNQLKIDSET